MIRTTLTAAALAIAALAAPAQADTISAYCMLMWDDNSKDTIKAPCTFSQYEGNAYVEDFNFYKFAFPAAEQGKTYERDNSSTSITFKRKGQYTLGVFWFVPKPEPGAY